VSDRQSKHSLRAVKRPVILHSVLKAGALASVLLLAACTDDIYSGLNQREANEIIAVLSENGIDATRSVAGETFGVSVAGSSLANAARVLRDAGLPRERYQTVTELFPGDSMIVTPFEQEARMAFALGQELSQTIESIDGVQSARVHVVLPRRDLRDRIISDSSASIALHNVAGTDSAVLNEQVRLIVANAVPALSADRVSITNFTGGLALNLSDSATVNTDTKPIVKSAMKMPSSGTSLEWILFGLAAALAAMAAVYVLLGSFARRST
jgi:type III secretion protein J